MRKSSRGEEEAQDGKRIETKKYIIISIMYSKQTAKPVYKKSQNRKRKKTTNGGEFPEASPTPPHPNPLPRRRVVDRVVVVVVVVVVGTGTDSVKCELEFSLFYFMCPGGSLRDIGVLWCRFEGL